MTKNMKSKILRVGFDLDGVILYNPARIMRPLISIVKRLLLHKTKLKFYYPHSPFEKWAWKQFHRSSIFIAPGMNELKMLVKEKKIIAYLVTSRFSFFGTGLMRWINKNNLDTVFENVYFNKNDEQPHMYKEKMIKKLDLDFFIEDNFDIVRFVNNKSKTKILWIYNIFDFFVDYPLKFASLKAAIKSII